MYLPLSKSLSNALLFGIFILLTSLECVSAINIFRSDTGRRLDLGTWNGNASLIDRKRFCIASVEGRRTSNIPAPYTIQLEPRGNGANTFELSSGDSVLPFTAQFTESLSGGLETLSPSTYTTSTFIGQTFDCLNGDNAQLEITVDETDLNNALAGRYRGRYRIRAQGGNNGTQTDNSSIVINATIDEVIRISNIENIIIDTYLKKGNVTEEISLCVYRNSIGNYRITGISNNPGGFELVNGSETIPYIVTVNDGASTSTLSPGLPLTNQQNANISSVDCNGGTQNNLRLLVTISSDIINAKPAGAYSDTLTIIVSPE